ncbi:MAG: cytochrome b/b6 domain-containing protein [Candidatus Caldarchaeum sp.]
MDLSNLKPPLIIFLATLLLFTAVSSIYAQQAIVITAYRAKKVPVIDGVISEGEWDDALQIKETVTKAIVAFKHDGQYLYVLAVFEDTSPSPKDYFGLEFDADGDQAHMGSEEVPDYALIVSPSYGSNHGKEVILPGAAKPILYESLGFRSNVTAKMEYHDKAYVVELARPLAMDARGMLELKIGQPVGIGFAVGEFGKGIEHRATDMTSYVLVLVSEQFEGKASQIFDFYGIVSEYAPYSWYVAVAAVLAHLVRRKAWKTAQHSETIVVERHVAAARIAHWVRVTALTVMIVTGYSIFMKQPVFGALSRDIHIWFAFAILLADLPLHIYSMVRKGEYKHLLKLSRDDIYVTMTIVKNFLGLTKEYPSHAVYDTHSNDYFMGRKYCSLQKPLVWFYFIAIVILGMTGFAMAYPSLFTWVFILLGGGLNLRALHLLFFYLFTAVFFAHIYLSLIPENWNRLRAIVKGTCKVPVVSLN